MDRNKVEIKLLKKNPEKLLLEYQGMIWAIVRNQLQKGLIAYDEQDDLFQEIMKKLLERLPRIQAQFNSTSQLRTYFSTIVRNICYEHFRKGSMVMEPQPESYGDVEVATEPVDSFLFKEEYERFQRVILMQDRNGSKLFLLLKIMHDLPILRSDLFGFKYNLKNEVINEVQEKLNACKDKMKKEKLATFGEILYLLEGKRIPPDSLRKWYSNHLNECLRLMNGNPPRSSYDAESLGILIEKSILIKKT